MNYNLNSTCKSSGVFPSANSLLLFILLLFIINPYISCFISIYGAFKFRESRFVFFSIIFFSLFNITIDGRQTDYSWYMPLFTSAVSTEMIPYVFSLHDAKEPLYTFYNYILSNMCNGNKILYSIISTIVIYLFVIKGLKSLCEYLHCDKIYLLFSCFTLLYFPFIFANTANLLRQYYAISMLLWSLPEILQGNKKFWLLAICSMFVHTSTGLIVMLLVLPFLNRRLSMLNSLFYIGLYVFFKCLPYLSNYLLSIFPSSIFDYVLHKLTFGTTFETEFSFHKILFSIVAVIVPYIIIYLNKNKISGNIVRFENIQLFLLIYILANLQHSELCERLNIFIWFFIPFNVLLVSYIYKLSRNTCLILSYALFVIFTIYEMKFTSFSYNCKNTFLLQPAPVYFFQSNLQYLN